MADRLRVVIAGGGLGGLTLAHLLLQQQPSPPSVVVLERDAAFGARNQGIVIGLRQEAIDVLELINGMTDILRVKLSDPTKVPTPNDLVIMGVGGDALIHVRNILSVALNHGKEKRGSLMDRSLLRNALAGLLPEGIIRWNSQVVKYDQVQDGAVEITLKSGERLTADVLIGADGARSQIRAQYAPALIPKELGLWSYAGAFALDDSYRTAMRETKNALFREASRGLTRVSCPKSGISMMSFVYASPEGSQLVLWSFSLPEDIKPSATDPLGQRQEVASLLEKNLPLTGAASMVKFTPEAGIMFPGYPMTSVPVETLGRDPFGHSDKQSHVTLLGDAAHKTTTQAGMGATAALQDAQDLAKTLQGATREQIPGLLRAYENRLVKRAKAVIGASAGNSIMLHTRRGPVKQAIIVGVMRVVGMLIHIVQSSLRFFL